MKKNKWLSMINLLPFTLCIILILCYLISNKETAIQTIINYTPETPWLAAFIILLLYLLKSLLVIFPILILEIASGHLFSTIPAIIINSIGILIGYILCYWIGHFSGKKTLDKLTRKYPAFQTILQKQNSNSFFMCFFLRTLFFLPGDAVSMYLGAAKTPFGRYLLASTLGSLPSTILATLFGASITDPSSPMFWISILLMTLFAGSSFLVYYVYKRKSPEDDAQCKTTC